MKCHIEIEQGKKTQSYQIRKGIGFQALAAKFQTPLEFDCRKSDCGICLFKVSEGIENLSPKTESEKDYLKAMLADDSERLACQSRIMGDIKILLVTHEMKDPKGIELTPSASRQAILLQNEVSEYKNKPLRLYLEGKGCDGFYYGVTFDQKESTDFYFSKGGIEVVVDPDTLVFTDGSLIDWIDDDRGKGFLVTNPNQKNFRGKFFKQSVWQKKLLENKSK